MVAFKTNPEALKDLLADVEKGKVRLPDFQRDWVWDDYRIRSLIASVSRGFPVGAVMTLQAGGAITFKTRLVEGVSGGALSEVDHFLLDGQQRLTSLYQALKSPNPTVTRDSRGGWIRRWYYVDMLKAMAEDGDREDAIVSVPEDKRTRDFRREVVLDVSAPELEYANHLLPTERLLNPTGWMVAYLKHWNAAEEEHPMGDPTHFFEQFEEIILETFNAYHLPVIDLSKETPKEAVCTVFEKVNTGGVTLTVFDLVTASFAADDFQLRDDWDERRRRLHDGFGVLRGIKGDQFLQAIALLATQKRRREKVREQPDAPPNLIPRIGCQKRDILNLTLADYEEWADKVEAGFMQAAKFLHAQFVFNSWNVPYATQLVPLATLFVELGNEAEPANANERLERWYWSGIFGESYGSAVETQYARDLVEVAGYVREGMLPTLVREANFTPERLLSLRTRNSAAYKGLYALQMKSGATDWRTGHSITLATYHDEAIDIHHIFPQAYCEHWGLPKELYNSIINKTPLTAPTNRIIGGRAPSEYVPRLRNRNEGLEESLRTHFVEPDLLEENNFTWCFMERGQAMLSLIGKAMGKNIPGGDSVFRSALNRFMPEKYRPGEESSDPDAQPELEEFDDDESDHEDEFGSAAYEPDGDNS